MRSTFVVLVILFLSVLTAAAAVPTVSYTIHIKSADLSGFDVDMRFSSPTPTVRVAMAAHPEYDDKYWRYIENFTAESADKQLHVSKTEDAVWMIDGARGIVVVRYRLHLPPQVNENRDAWKPFLTTTGGMVGDLHSLMYVVGNSSAPSQLTLDMPADWKAASGLEANRDARTFTGPAELMLDAPVMVGKFQEWSFTAGRVPHKIVVWSPAGAPTFDSAPLVDGVKKIAAEAIRKFGVPPYRRYVFLFQNGGEAALEHLTSVNIGHTFSRGMDGLFEEVAHEYFHAWNLMDVRPVERVGLQPAFARPTGVLWWNEGATIMFADYLLRRSGLPGPEASRIRHLETAMTRYFSSPGYATLSAEQMSRGDTDPAGLGDYGGSTHLHGELLSTMLDLMIRDRSNGRHDVADVMTLLSDRFDYRRGITNHDIEQAALEVCPTCDVHTFFREHIYGAGQIDFDKYLGLMGMRSEVTRSAALGSDGTPSVDLRIGPLQNDVADGFKIRITNPQSAWGKAGLHTGNRLLSVDGTPVSSWPDLRSWLRTLKIGDVGRLEIMHDGVKKMVEVPVAVYDVPAVKISEITAPTPRQLKLRNAWINAN